MGLDVWTGSAWADAKDVDVWTGSAWSPAKKVKVWNGSSWVLSWVPKVASASLSLSKTGVGPSETYNVSLTAPGGYPEGAAVTFRFTGYSHTVYPSEGSTVATLAGASHGAEGSVAWYADVVTAGGTTTFGPVTQTVESQGYHVVLASGSSRASIQSAMDAASSWFLSNLGGSVNFDDPSTMATVELAAGGTFTLDGTALHYRRGVRLIGGGSGASRPLVKGTSATHVFNGNNNGGGGYNAPHYDWLVQNIRFDCGNHTGGFSIAHVRRFRIKGCDFSNMGGKKHYIEINSSGGARQDGTYNCQVYDCYFTMSNRYPTNHPRRTLDECIQLDYSWKGSASDVANDGTIANNVIISGCSFYRVPRAIGAHHFEIDPNGVEADPLGIPANILITGCVFNEVDPDLYGEPISGDTGGSGSGGSEGAVRGYVWENMRITQCQFTQCTHPIMFFIPGDAPGRFGDPEDLMVDHCTFTSLRSIDARGRTHVPIRSDSNHASLRMGKVQVHDNTFNGTWEGADYAVEIIYTNSSLLPSGNGVEILRNRWEPSNKTLAEEKAYNKYRGVSAELNGAHVLIDLNTVSDGSEDNS